MPFSQGDLNLPTVGEIYDALFATKQYKQEVSLLREAFGRDWTRGLDFGCGTGSHTLELASHGIEMRGIDRDKALLDRASHKLMESGLPEGRVTFSCGPVFAADVGTFDFVVALFNVANYCLTEKDLRTFFSEIRGSAMAAEVYLEMWDADIARQDPPHNETRDFLLRGSQARLTINPHLDSAKNFCFMERSIVWGAFESGSISLFRESLWHRIWTREEVLNAALDAGFAGATFCTWREIGGEAVATRRILAVLHQESRDHP